MTTNAIRPDDALKYAAAKLKSCTEWATDSIGAKTETVDDELDAINATVTEICGLAMQLPSRGRYSDGRAVVTRARILDGLVTEVVWHPDPAQDSPSSWRAALPSDPDVASPGVYEVMTDPATQDVHVRVVRLA